MRGPSLELVPAAPTRRLLHVDCAAQPCRLHGGQRCLGVILLCLNKRLWVRPAFQAGYFPAMPARKCCVPAGSVAIGGCGMPWVAEGGTTLGKS